MSNAVKAVVEIFTQTHNQIHVAGIVMYCAEHHQAPLTDCVRQSLSNVSTGIVLVWTFAFISQVLVR